MKQLVEVAAAIIIRQGKIFCAKRSSKKALPLKWEFPGGKIEKGETHEVALKREILEELSCDVRIISHFMSVEYEYPLYMVKLHTYICQPRECTLQLNEHIEARFLAPSQLLELDWAPADYPIIEALSTYDFSILGEKLR
jgi:8-oxo-dGTP diphosphatase